MALFKEKIAWSNEVKFLLSPSMANDPLNSILSIEQDVLSGICQVVGIFEKNILTGAFVIRIDINELGKELIVVTGASNSHNLTKISIKKWQELAQKYKCEYIRIHTNLKALGRILIKNDFKLSEMVLRQRVA